MKTTKENSRGTRLNAVIVGVAFIIATTAGIAAAAIGRPIIDAPDYLAKIAANENTVSSAHFFNF